LNGDQLAKAIGALASLAWVGLAGYALYLLRNILPNVVGGLAGFEAFGLKLSMSGGRAMEAAIEMARKQVGWQVEIPEADREAALARANRERKIIEGAEILWVDDRPSNNRNEARMLRSFGALITFACTTEEAMAALWQATEQMQPFHIVISDINRELPDGDPRAGLAMIDRFRAEKIALPLILYVGKLDTDAGVPNGAFGVTNRPDQLLQLVLDALARVRRAS
jgi:CheY-like chemotaxis protein